jgi:hypothetical protein
MTWSASAIAHVNKMNRAAQDVLLGTMLATLSGSGTAVGGTTTPTTGSLCLVDTGLTVIKGYSVCLTGSPIVEHTLSTACAVGAYLNIRSWCPTAAGDTALKSASSAWLEVSWIAVGED